MFEPLLDAPGAVAETGPERILVVADYHAGVEVGLRRDGVEIDSRADSRRERLLSLVERTGPDRVLLLGDVGDAIDTPRGAERTELRRLFEALLKRASVTVTRGNHDGNIEAVTDGFDIEVSEGPGVRIGSVGFCHGHTWPGEAVLDADVVCTAHEHPLVRLTDEVGGGRSERVWLRGRLDPAGFADSAATPPAETEAELVVCPAFNDLVGGTHVNESTSFLSPFLPDGLKDGQAYLLDGTRLGDYRAV
ncbi:MAG: metallophosphoesterase [Natronomonas sp.]